MGLIIFAIGFTTGLNPTSGTDLPFKTLPAASDGMAFGKVIAIAFFGVLATSISMLAVGVAGAMRSSEWPRGRATAGLTGVILLARLPSALGSIAVDLRVFDRPFPERAQRLRGAHALPSRPPRSSGSASGSRGDSVREYLPASAMFVHE